ncbi:MAG: hypothetical protein ABH854_04860, partial [Candidatus Diapherotrites archaeon]
MFRKELSGARCFILPLLPALALLLFFASAAYAPVMDVNASGLDFTVGTADWELFYDYSWGAIVSGIYDLNRDGAAKTNLTVANRGIDTWSLYNTSISNYESSYGQQPGLKLGLNEDLNSRVTIRVDNAFSYGTKMDLNFTKIHTIYPIIGGLRIISHMEITDTNALDDGENFSVSIHRTFANESTADILGYGDNNSVEPPTDTEWWRANQRYDMPETADGNSMIVTGYVKSAEPSFYDNIWDVDNEYYYRHDYSGWYDNDLAPMVYGQMEYLNTIILLSDTKTLGGGINLVGLVVDENQIDYRMLDWRNPDDLYMKTGTFSEFDFNTGAYLLTASANQVDFNISTNGIQNDQGNWDTNRYSPA